MEIDNKVIKKLVKKGIKSKFQNCFQCKFFPYNYNKDFFNKYRIYKGWYFGIENIEKLDFRCQYLHKSTSQSLKVFRTNSCICFKKINQI